MAVKLMAEEDTFEFNDGEKHSLEMIRGGILLSNSANIHRRGLSTVSNRIVESCGIKDHKNRYPW